ncbi:unnamed protein product, partial [Meganyctiphanes norvegica]
MKVAMFILQDHRLQHCTRRLKWPRGRWGSCSRQDCHFCICLYTSHTHDLMFFILYLIQVYTKYGGSMFSGRYELQSPALVIGDPELINHIFIKDFDHFRNHRRIFTKKGDVMMKHNLFFIEGDDAWKKLRSVMSTAFSSGKLKGSFPLVLDQADKLVQYCMKTSIKNNEFDVSKIFGAFALDTVASVSFGFEANSVENTESEFVQAAKNAFAMSTFEIIRFLIVSNLPRSIIETFGLYSLDSDKESIHTLNRIAVDALNTRKKGKKRGDFLDILLEAQVDYPEILTDKCIAAQGFIFLSAGYHTTAVASSFTAYFLAKHPEYQEKIRREVQELKIINFARLNFSEICLHNLYNAAGNTTRKIHNIKTVQDGSCDGGFVVGNRVLKDSVVVNPCFLFHNYESCYWLGLVSVRHARLAMRELIASDYFLFAESDKACF